MREALDLAPQLTFAREQLVHGLIMLGKHDEALAECQRAVEMGGSRERALLAYVHAESGHRAEALAILEEMLGPARDRYAPPCHVAYVYAALGEIDTAIEWLERAFEEVDTHLNGLAIIRAYDPLRSDPRFVAMVARLKHEPLP